MRRLVLLAGLIGLIGSLAHGGPPGELPDALRGVKPATGMCTRDDPRSASQNPPGDGSMLAVDGSCGIGVREVVALGAKADVMLIDLRGHELHAQTAIEGSLSMSTSELRTKAFLQSRPIVLIGNGKGQRDLLATCAQLKAQGFAKAKVLLGGMPAWIAQGQPVVGLHQGIDEVPSLSSAELWMEAQFDANLIVVAEPLRGLQLRMPNAMVLTDLSPKPVQRALEQRRKSRAPAVASVVVASPTALSMNQLLALREALRPLPILSYAGTADTFAKDMQRQSSVWVAHARGPKPPGCGL